MINTDFEVLAPAGSFQTFKAVIEAGADAVYVGGSRFGARAYADNFTEEELLQAIEKMLDAKLEEKLDKKLDEKLTPIHERLDSLETRMDSMESQIGELKERFTAMEEKQDLMNESIGVILEWADEVHTARDLPLPKIL